VWIGAAEQTPTAQRKGKPKKLSRCIISGFFMSTIQHSPLGSVVCSKKIFFYAQNLRRIKIYAHAKLAVNQCGLQPTRTFNKKVSGYPAGIKSSLL
jgi:hypothetical protein